MYRKVQERILQNGDGGREKSLRNHETSETIAPHGKMALEKEENHQVLGLNAPRTRLYKSQARYNIHPMKRPHEIPC